MQSVLPVIVWVTACSTFAIGDEPFPPESSPKLQYLISRWQDVRFEGIGNAAEYRFQETPLMQWQNPISKADGAVFAWTSAGRPVVLCKCHVNDEKRHYVASSVSLAPQPFVMKMHGQTVWTPKQAGIDRRPVLDAGTPAEREAARLVQMRAIARRYRMLSVWGEENSSQWELRLLPTPLMRYRSESAGVVDGAIFGFAQGTNPETVVVVEAIKAPKGLEWQAAPSRITGYAVKAWFDDQLVLDVPAVRQTIRDGTYHHVYERPSPYPFPK